MSQKGIQSLPDVLQHPVVLLLCQIDIGHWQCLHSQFETLFCVEQCYAWAECVDCRQNTGGAADLLILGHSRVTTKLLVIHSVSHGDCIQHSWIVNLCHHLIPSTSIAFPLPPASRQVVSNKIFRVRIAKVSVLILISEPSLNNVEGSGVCRQIDSKEFPPIPS